VPTFFKKEDSNPSKENKSYRRLTRAREQQEQQEQLLLQNEKKKNEREKDRFDLERVKRDKKKTHGEKK
jgi:hypothetical protein